MLDTTFHSNDLKFSLGPKPYDKITESVIKNFHFKYGKNLRLYFRKIYDLYVF